MDGTYVNHNFFHLPDVNPAELSPAVWAYIGDAVYELFIRNLLVSRGPAKTGRLHQEAVQKVKASFQAQLLDKIEPLLDEGELDIVKRGRNTKTGHVPSGSDVLTYRHSTAFEALLGFLYLSGKLDRIVALLEQALNEDGGDMHVEG